MENLGNFIVQFIASCIVIAVYRKHKSDYSQIHSTFWPRFWGPTVDGVVLFPITIISELAFLNQEASITTVNAFVLVTALVQFLYNICMNAIYGASLGKMATKIKIIRNSDNQKIGFKEAVLRDIVPLVIVVAFYLFSGSESLEWSLTVSMIMMLWFLAEVVTMLSNEKRRALHDYIAGTVVVRSDLNV